MQKREAPLGKAVRVYWQDSAANHGWKGVDEEVGSVLITTLGYVLKCDATDLTLSNSFSNEMNVMCPLSIPWVSIHRCEDLPETYDKTFKLD